VHVYVEYEPDAKLCCPTCGASCTRYDTRKKTWRHLDTCQYQTIVHCEVPRSHCTEHGPLQIEVPWAEKGGRYTLMFEALVVSWLQETSINAVSRKLNLSWNAIDGIKQRAVKRGLTNREATSLAHLSVDEVSQKKGHRYVTVISTSSGHVLDVQDGKGADSLGAFYRSLKPNQLDDIKTISMDMSPAYIRATVDHVPEATSKICFDKFHVAQDLNKAVDAVRRKESSVIVPDKRKALHLSRFIWLRNEDRLTENHHIKIDYLKSVAVKTARAWAIRQYAMSLWNYRYPASATKAWNKWCSWAIRSRLRPIKTAAKSIKKNLWGIVNAIVHQKTNALAESLNAKIKMIKVKAKGFRNKERFKTAILFHLDGLKLYP
jgi:transposase